MPQENEPRIAVIFRKFKNGEIIALFPELPGTNDPETCLSYQQIGQHGSAGVDLCDRTKPAKPEEFASLQAELESIGYRLRLCTKRTAKMDRARLKALKSIA